MLPSSRVWQCPKQILPRSNIIAWGRGEEVLDNIWQSCQHNSIQRNINCDQLTKLILSWSYKYNIRFHIHSTSLNVKVQCDVSQNCTAAWLSHNGAACLLPLSPSLCSVPALSLEAPGLWYVTVCYKPVCASEKMQYIAEPMKCGLILTVQVNFIICQKECSFLASGFPKEVLLYWDMFRVEAQACVNVLT